MKTAITVNWEFWTVIAGVAGVIALVFTILGYKVGSGSVSRQLGYDKASFRLADCGFSNDQVALALVKPSALKVPMLGINDLNDMVRLNPVVRIVALDDRPLEALRVEVTPTDGALDFFIDVTDGVTEDDKKMTPWALSRVMAKDYIIVDRPRKGQTVNIPIADLLIKHMAQFQVKEPQRRQRAHYGKFAVRVYAKLAGSPNWSEETSNKYCMYQYFWYPTGFPEKDCEEFVSRFNQPPALSP